MYGHNKTREMKVKEFKKAMGQPIGKSLTVDEIELLRNLIQEECDEVWDAFDETTQEITIEGGQPTREQWAHLLKELCDLQYVLSGAIVSIGAISGDFDVAFNRVHRSNMSKLGEDGKPIYNKDGKVLKGPNYQPPKLEDLIKEN